MFFVSENAISANVGVLFVTNCNSQCIGLTVLGCMGSHGRRCSQLDNAFPAAFFGDLIAPVTLGTVEGAVGGVE